MTFFKGSVERAAEYFNNQVANKTLTPIKMKIIKDSVSAIREKFKTRDYMGSFQVEDFVEGKINRITIHDQVDAFLNSIKI